MAALNCSFPPGGTVISLGMMLTNAEAGGGDDAALPPPPQPASKSVSTNTERESNFWGVIDRTKPRARGLVAKKQSG